jgi:hypothetical protein
MVAQSPWIGYAPDIDPTHTGPGACSAMNNLIAREGDSGLGEFLTHPPGWTEVEATVVLGDPGHIVGLGLFYRTDSSGGRGGEYDLTTMAIVAGDGTTPDSADLYRLLQAGSWDIVPRSTKDDSIGLFSVYPAEDNSYQLFDIATCSFGASPRTPVVDLGTTTATEPLFIFTNGVDPVMVYPVDTGSGTENGSYEILTSAFGTGSAAFKARSVETWGDRINFLNTTENGIEFRQRLRRTAIGNADPDTANNGTGFIDFEQFSGDGLRVESLGDLLACYFEDGMAVVRRSGNPSAPYHVQEINDERGLLSTHSLVNIGDGTHFGLFTDGWYFVNANGQFREAGMANLNGSLSAKWRRTFFRRLDLNKRSRISMQYDSVNSWIYITLPLDNASENSDVWIYDIDGDRVFPNSWAVTCFGHSNVQVSTAVTIGELDGVGDHPGPNIGDLTGSIGSFGASYGVKSVLHGTSVGEVFTHDAEISAQDGTEPSYSYQTHYATPGDPRTVNSIREVFLEHLKKAGMSNPVVKITGSPSDGGQLVTLDASAGTADDIVTIYNGMTHSSDLVSFQISGTGPIWIRRMGADMLNYRGRKIWS